MLSFYKTYKPSYESFEAEIHGTILGKAFLDPRQILYAMVCTVSVNVAVMIDLLFDFFVDYEFSKWDDKFERLSMVLATIIPGVVLLNSAYNPNMSLTFAFSHVCQILGCFAPIYSLCIKLVPDFFHFPGLLTSYAFAAFSGVLTVTVGLDKPLHHWSNILLIVFMIISTGIFFQMVLKWARSVYARAKPVTENWYAFKITVIPKIMSEKEICCLLYLLCTFGTIVCIPSVTAFCCVCQWRNWGLTAICVNIYSLAAFSVLPSCIPGRLKQHYARKMINTKIKTNRATIRYISHEIRSPLNIVQNGIKLVLEDLQGVCNNNIVDSLQDVLHASSAATTIVDDLLNFEKIDAGKFHLERRLEPASMCLGNIVKRCEILAQHKHIVFKVNNLLKDVHGKIVATCIDEIKIEQVLRNLIVNSIKFTPIGGLIEIFLLYEDDSENAVSAQCESFYYFGQCSRDMPLQKCADQQMSRNFRETPVATPDPPMIETSKESKCSHLCVPLLKFIAFVKGPAKVSPALYVEQKNQNYPGRHYVRIVVKDNGAGIAKDQFANVFGEFNQFSANNLQGGGGSGLGLWICKEIITQHQGKIYFDSNGAGQGTVFSIVLNAQLCTHEELQPLLCSKEQKATICERKEGKDIQQDCFTAANKTFLQNFKEMDDLAGTGAPSVLVRVLVVDDIKMNRKILVQMIMKIASMCNDVELKVHEADDGQTALDCMANASEEFDMIFIDNIMTALHGPEAVEKMRQQGFKGLVVGVTGNVMEDDLADFIKHGANDVVKKPVCADQLGLIIRKYLAEMKCRKKENSLSAIFSKPSKQGDYPEIMVKK